jgi:hypothetical protein
MVDKVVLGQAFSEYFGFPCQSSFHQFLHNHHHLSSRAVTIGQYMAAVPEVPPHKLKKKKVYTSNPYPLIIISSDAAELHEDCNEL